MKNCCFHKHNNRTLREAIIQIKNTPLRSVFNKWCAILCDYRTKDYDNFKQLIKKIKLFEDSFSTEPIYL